MCLPNGLIHRHGSPTGQLSNWLAYYHVSICLMAKALHVLRVQSQLGFIVCRRLCIAKITKFSLVLARKAKERERLLHFRNIYAVQRTLFTLFTTSPHREVSAFSVHLYAPILAQQLAPTVCVLSRVLMMFGQRLPSITAPPPHLIHLTILPVLAVLHLVTIMASY